MKTSWQTWAILALAITVGWLAFDKVRAAARRSETLNAVAEMRVLEAQHSEDKALKEARALKIRVKELELELSQERALAKTQNR